MKRANSPSNCEAGALFTNVTVIARNSTAIKVHQQRVARARWGRVSAALSRINHRLVAAGRVIAIVPSVPKPPTAPQGRP
jgi:hypothetical protein